jgi:2-haloacid dehalogenase
MGEGRPSIVVFDLGGVLIDWNPRHLYRKLFDDPAEMERFLTEVCHHDWNLEQDRGRTFAEAVAEATSRHPGARLHVEAWFSRWIEMIGGPITGTVELLEALDAAGTPLYALTNWSAETFPLVRHDPTYAFLDRFREIVVSGEIGLIKPDPAIYRHLLARVGAPAESCLFIDDNVANVAAAAALGLHAHRFTDPPSLRRTLEGHGLLAPG